jgi:hypothetical protein
MDRREARLALDLARQWAREGLLPQASLQAIEQRHAGDVVEDPDRESFGASVLYALGGVLLGCAVFAFMVLLQDNADLSYESAEDVAPWLFLGWGILCGAGAFALDLLLRKPRLGDALHVAALVAITASGFPHAEDLPLGFLAVLYAGAIVWYRRGRFLVPFLALVALNVAITSILFGRVARAADEELAFGLWFAFALVQVPSLAYASRRTAWPWPTFSLAAATLLLGGTFVGWYLDVADDFIGGFDGDAEVYLALLMGSALGAGLYLREKGLVLAAALVIAIDAVVFAFDVGEVVGGLVAILAVAALLIWQAGNLRRYLRET